MPLMVSTWGIMCDACGYSESGWGGIEARAEVKREIRKGGWTFNGISAIEGCYCPNCSRIKRSKIVSPKARVDEALYNQEEVG